MIKLLCFHTACDWCIHTAICMYGERLCWMGNRWMDCPRNNYLIQEKGKAIGLTQCVCVCVLNHGLLQSVREHEIPLHQPAINADVEWRKVWEEVNKKDLPHNREESRKCSLYEALKCFLHWITRSLFTFTDMQMTDSNLRELIGYWRVVLILSNDTITTAALFDLIRGKKTIVAVLITAYHTNSSFLLLP